MFWLKHTVLSVLGAKVGPLFGLSQPGHTDPLILMLDYYNMLYMVLALKTF